MEKYILPVNIVPPEDSQSNNFSQEEILKMIAVLARRTDEIEQKMRHAKVSTFSENQSFKKLRSQINNINLYIE